MRQVYSNLSSSLGYYLLFPRRKRIACAFLCVKITDKQSLFFLPLSGYLVHVGDVNQFYILPVYCNLAVCAAHSFDHV